GSHGDAEVVERLVYVFYSRAFLDQELRLAQIGPQHAVPDKAACVSGEHSDFVQLLREGHRGGQHFLARTLAADDFEQPHNVCGAEVVMTDHEFRAARDGRDLVDIEIRRVGREDAAGLRDLVDLGEYLFL